MSTPSGFSHSSGSAEHSIPTNQFSDLNTISLDSQPACDLLTFKYTPLDAEKPEIRLLTLLPGKSPTKIECQLHHISLEDQAASYEALSYTWGDPTPVEVLSLNRLQLRIAVNLHTALIRLRHEDSPRVLWIDAICINQHDIQEKNHQVMQMTKIYGGAKQVVAWLGEEVQDTYLAIAKLKETANIPIELIAWDPSKRTELNSELRRCEDTWAAIQDIANRPYWYRAWIVQELTAAKDAIIICGQHVIPWYSLREAHKRVTFAFHMGEKKTGGVESTGFAQISRLDAFPDWNTAKNRSILNHIADFIHWKVTNPLDRIYAFSGLPSLEDISDFQVNYGLSEEKLFEVFARWHILKTRTLDILAFACPTSHTRLDGQIKLRTKWIPDWENRYVKALTWVPFPGVNPIFHTSGDTKVDHLLRIISDYTIQPVLPCFGFEIDEVKEVGDVLEPGPADTFHPHSPLMQQWESVMNKLHLQRNPYSIKGIDTSDFQYYDVSDFGNKVTLQTFSLPSDIEPERLALVEAYWRTLIADRWDIDTFVPKETVPKYRADRSIWRYWADWHDGAQRQRHGFTIFHQRISIAAVKRRFMITKNNYMGLAPESTQVGDRICVFFGGQTPYIVRRAPGYNPVHFVGDAFVQGMMDGEAMEKYTNGEQSKEIFQLL